MSDEKYKVRIPLKHDPSLLIGATRLRAEKLFLSVERRSARNPKGAELYSDFIREYESLGHMREVPISDHRKPQAVYLPHHPVVKLTSQTTKLRVVFNASTPSSTRTSINDCQMVGPNLQSDLTLLLARWCCCRYVLAADVNKMYRQI